MSGSNRDRTWQGGGSAAGEPDAWHVDRELLWAWIDDLLRDVPLAALDADALHALCAQALDTHAPAVLVHAQAAGVLLEHLVAAAIVEAYADRYGRPDDQYEIERVCAIVHYLKHGTATAA